MNKKGSTLIELVISIALISVVLVFMVKLLVDINNAESNNDYAKENQIIRAEIIRAIETEIGNKRLTNVIVTEDSPEQSKVTFEFDGDTDTKTISTIVVKSNNLTFIPTTGEDNKRSWTLKEGTFDFKNIYNDFSTDSTNKLQMLNLNIEVHTQNNNNTNFDNDLKTRNNILDDITISYIKKK